MRDVVTLIHGVNYEEIVGVCDAKQLPKELPRTGSMVVGRCSSSLTQLVWIVIALGFKCVHVDGNMIGV